MQPQLIVVAEWSHMVAEWSRFGREGITTMSETPNKGNSAKKRDRSNVDENGFNKDDRYRQKKKLVGSANENTQSSGTTSQVGPSNTTSSGASPSKSIQVPIEVQRPSSDILKALKEARHPFAICEVMDGENLEELDRFKEIESKVVDWLSQWGGLSNWPEWLEATYRQAKKENRFDDWLEQVWEQADQGRRLETRLFQMYSKLPREHYKVKELYRHSVELVHLVAKAIALIEIRAPLIPDKCSIHPSDSSQPEDHGEEDWSSGLDDY
ncbi:hypothetical protein NP233_g8385 [Leucocoprinus birnbaumii]|uniref:Uncharacterized protein n=1 Tax=Leucocoprinus birnbaumii TaxID=56174 RepID=A0AAD5YTT6_9AGAR|nr:hypothetical protein NP233_g8385 [Leucocoprinus birnbaumii]